MYSLSQDNFTLQSLHTELCAHVEIVYIYAIAPRPVIQLLSNVAAQRDTLLLAYDTQTAVLDDVKVKC